MRVPSAKRPRVVAHGVEVGCCHTSAAVDRVEVGAEVGLDGVVEAGVDGPVRSEEDVVASVEGGACQPE